MKEQKLNKLQKLKDKLFGEDMQKWEQIKIWLIGIAVFVGVIGAFFGLRAIVNMQKQEDPTTAPTVSTTVPTVPTTVPTQPMEPTNPTEPTVPTTAPTEPPHTHTWADATCTTPMTCTECGVTEGEALGHTWQNATCTNPKTCAVCGAAEGELLAHAWDDGVVLKEATEEIDGEILYTCTACGETKTQIVPSLGHAHAYTDVVVTNPTCTEKGYTTHTCRCGDSYTDSETPALGHEWQDATCVSAKTCQTCGATDGAAKGHKWTEATCTAPKTCSVCGTKDGTALGHNYSKVVTAPTCTAQGYTTYTCTRCEDAHISDYVNALGHRYADATCTTPKTCTACGHIDGTALGHDYDSVVTPPTQEAQGYTTYTCTRCGYSYVGDYTDPVTALDENGTLVFRTDGVAYLYGDNSEVVKTYTGWETKEYRDFFLPPWYSDRDNVIRVVIEDGVTPVSTDNWFNYCKKLTNVTMGNGITSIGDSAFSGCSSLTSITIPDSVTSIDDWAFFGCSSLTSITIPDSVTSIGYNAFYCCSSLTSITVAAGNAVYQSAGNCIIETKSKTLIAGCKNSVIPDDGSVTSIGNAAFHGCSGLTSITIPHSVTSIGEKAFSGCSGLTSITIPNSVTSIGEKAFSGCSSLTSITIPNSVTSIGSDVFSDCYSLTSITIPDSVTSIGSDAFSDCYSLTSITIPDSVTRIGSYAFSNCYSLISVAIPDSVISIGYSAFSSCESLTSVTIGSGVTSIGDDAFNGCSGLTSITIPNSVTSIGDDAFRGCSGLTSITIPNSVTSIGYAPFSNCSSLTSITVAAGNAVYQSAGNCIIETKSKTLIAGCKNSVIPDDGSATSIGFAAFHCCSGLTSITIPDSVTSIGDSAFRDCTSLTSVTIPDSVTSIGVDAFSGCSSLTSITIPDSVTCIGDFAFRFCESLTSVTIGSGVTSIGDYTFYECTSLTSITFEGTMEQWNAISKGFDWSGSVPATEVVCSDGKVTLS